MSPRPHPCRHQHPQRLLPERQVVAGSGGSPKIFTDKLGRTAMHQPQSGWASCLRTSSYGPHQTGGSGIRHSVQGKRMLFRLFFHMPDKLSVIRPGEYLLWRQRPVVHPDRGSGGPGSAAAQLALIGVLANHGPKLSVSTRGLQRKRPQRISLCRIT